MAKKQFVNPLIYDPFRTPDWRYKRAMAIVNHNGRCGTHDDEYTKVLRHFVATQRNGTDKARAQLKTKRPGLITAWQINAQRIDDFQTPTMIECRLLAGMSNAEIAAEIGCIDDVIEWYEAVFFNVRDRLQAHDWIVRHVLMPAINNNRGYMSPRKRKKPKDPKDRRDPMPDTGNEALAEPFYDSTLKFFGYFGGPLLVEYMISGFRRGVMAHTRDDFTGWFDQHFSHGIRRRSSTAVGMFNVNKYNVMQLFETHARLMEIDRNTESNEDASSTIENNILGFMRNMPWGVAADGAENFKGTRVIDMDTKAAELRDDELLMLASGEEPESIKGIEALSMPSPRQLTHQPPDPENPDAAAKQDK
jgi:hypothetical protein